MSTLAGKTLFITGASRGIGLAIALRAARDGANIAIAAKTAAPHPSLPGTIYTAAAEVEAAGGKALPLLCNIRNDEQVETAVAECVKRFGGIDICVNNASAISLSATLDTGMKRYDLMHGVNSRGTFAVSRACLPHLLAAANPHILTISPPLDLAPKWFAPHVAYTMAKFGMSLCMLGMAAEFRKQGVACNCLWPRTAIATAAIRNIVADAAALSHCRKPEIMADAAHAILTQPSRECTGRFFIDDTLLLERGVTDFTIYDMEPGLELMADFFVPEGYPAPAGLRLLPLGRRT